MSDLIIMELDAETTTEIDKVEDIEDANGRGSNSKQQNQNAAQNQQQVPQQQYSQLNQPKIDVAIRFRDEPDITSEELECWSFDHSKNQVTFPLKQKKTQGKLEVNKIVDAWQQEEVYHQYLQAFVAQCFEGFNFSVMTYGPAGTGKTYTTLGSDDCITELLQFTDKQVITEEARKQLGMFPRAVYDIFDQIKKRNALQNQDDEPMVERWEQLEFEVELTILEVHNEKILNLLGKQQEVIEKVINFQKTAKFVSNPEDVIVLLSHALRKAHFDRSSSKTSKQLSFRGHMIYSLNVVQANVTDNSKKSGRVTFVDLASYDSTATQSQESYNGDRVANNHVMRSLYQLDQVVNSLNNPKQKVVPYQSSKLTKCLTDVIGGNSKTLCMFFCSRKFINLDQSVKTLKFASNIQKVKNKPKMNFLQDTQEEEDNKYSSLMKKIEEKLKNKKPLQDTLDQQRGSHGKPSQNHSNMLRFSFPNMPATPRRTFTQYKKFTGSLIEPCQSSAANPSPTRLPPRGQQTSRISFSKSIVEAPPTPRRATQVMRSTQVLSQLDKQHRSPNKAMASAVNSNANASSANPANEQLNQLNRKYNELQTEYQKYKMKNEQEQKVLKQKIAALQSQKIKMSKEIMDVKQEFAKKEQFQQKQVKQLQKDKEALEKKKQKETQFLEKEIHRQSKLMQSQYSSKFNEEKCVQDLQEILQSNEKIEEYQQIIKESTSKLVESSMSTLNTEINAHGNDIRELKQRLTEEQMIAEPLQIYTKLLEISHGKEQSFMKQVQALSQDNLMLTQLNEELIKLLKDQQRISKDQDRITRLSLEIQQNSEDALGEIRKLKELQSSYQAFNEFSNISIDQAPQTKRDVSPINSNEINEEIRTSWKLFEKISSLGQGAFGDVLKIRCLQSTCLDKDATYRIQMGVEMELKTKKTRQIQEQQAGVHAAIMIDGLKSMFKDDFYVSKTINVAHLDNKGQFEALNEIATMQTLNSPYIVGYYDSFIDEQVDEPQINIIIEYCHNGDLCTFLEEQSILHGKYSYLNEVTVWRIFINICLGLEHMHSKDYIHRDLKTLNVFMTQNNVAKIGDLGCALNLIQHRNMLEQKKSEKEQKKLRRDIDEQLLTARTEFGPLEEDEVLIDDDIKLDTMLTERSNKESTLGDTTLSDEEPVGTPYYLSPEIWMERKYSKQSDIWSLGVILYELLHFQKPFPANEKDELIEKVCNQPPDRIRSSISAPMQHLITIMLNKDPSKRPSVEEIIMTDEFQSNATKLGIDLPLMLNKLKIIQKIASDEHGDLILTPFQQALFDKEIKQAANMVQKVERKITVSKKITGGVQSSSRLQKNEHMKGLSKVRAQQKHYGQYVLENSRNRYAPPPLSRKNTLGVEKQTSVNGNRQSVLKRKQVQQPLLQNRQSMKKLNLNRVHADRRHYDSKATAPDDSVPGRKLLGSQKGSDLFMMKDQPASLRSSVIMKRGKPSQQVGQVLQQQKNDMIMSKMVPKSSLMSNYNSSKSPQKPIRSSMHVKSKCTLLSHRAPASTVNVVQQTQNKKPKQLKSHRIMDLGVDKCDETATGANGNMMVEKFMFFSQHTEQSEDEQEEEEK